MIRSVLLIWCFAGAILAKPATIGRAREQRLMKSFTLEDVVTPGRFTIKGFNGTWISDSRLLYKSSGNLNIYDVSNKTSEILIPSAELEALKLSGYEMSPDEKYLLLKKDVISGFRHSTSAKYDIYDILSKSVTPIGDGDHLQVAKWAPVGNSIAYVKDNNVFYRPNALADAKEIQLTMNGEPGVIYNGVTDWVYEEEMFGSGSALWFSPDASFLAISTFDDTNVEEAFYFNYGVPGDLASQYAELLDIRYPKPGTPNPVVGLKVIDVTKPNTTWVEIAAPVDDVSKDHLLGSVTWAGTTTLAPTWLNRRQNISVLQVCDALTAVCKTLKITTEPNGWIDVKSPVFDHDTGVYFQIQSVKQTDGSSWPHLVIGSGGASSSMTSGNSTVIKIFGHDVANTLSYYLATAEEDPAQRHVYRVGGPQGIECITCSITTVDSQPCLYADAVFSKSFKYITLTCSGPGPSHVEIIEAKTLNRVIEWEMNTEVRSVLSEYASPSQFDTLVPVPGGFHAKVRLLLPPGLDVTKDDQKYPMIVFVYAGPNSVRVTDGFGIGYPEYVTTNLSAIYCQIDGRGSGYKGNDLLFTINNAMGTVEIEDQINVTKFLQNTYPWIDADRTAIWGWSYGGYATAMAIATDTEHVFACGVSVAPVTSWIYYDTIYTERYMGLPTEDDNLLGYNISDVTRRAEAFRDRRFLLVHGNADDNVHYQQSMALSRALQLADVMFTQQSYPNEAHGLVGVLPHLYHTIGRFWDTCLFSENTAA